MDGFWTNRHKAFLPCTWVVVVNLLSAFTLAAGTSTKSLSHTNGSEGEIIRSPRGSDIALPCRVFNDSLVNAKVSWLYGGESQLIASFNTSRPDQITTNPQLPVDISSYRLLPGKNASLLLLGVRRELVERFMCL